MNYTNGTRVAMAALIAAAGVPSYLHAQQQTADIVLTGGKVITVDEQFSIAQAVAIKGDRIVAVGRNAEINALAGPDTRRINLRGRSLMPGFIDNHAHLQEEGRIWGIELRLDGIETRKEALAMIAADAARKGAGEWVFVLGGWSPDQFLDDSEPFTREELDRAAPDNPVFLQFTREQYYLNSKAIDLAGVDAMTDSAIQRDANGRPTGILSGERVDQVGGRIADAAGFLERIPDSNLEPGTMQMLREFAIAGLTASQGACQYEDEYIRWRREGKPISMRFFCTRTSTGRGKTTEQVIADIPTLKYHDGDEWMDHAQWSERFVNVIDNVYDMGPTVPTATWNEWGRMARAVAAASIPAQIHTTMEWTIEAQLEQIEAFAKDVPVRGKRWGFMHMEQVTPAQLERMRNLGMYVATNPRGVISGAAFVRRYGERGYAMPNLRALQDSGILWGFGTDAFEVNQFRPFATLGYAVTGRILGEPNGKLVMKFPISREEALIAHTRSNAYILNRENDLGSIAPGKLADMFIADKDYLTVPAGQIHTIKSVMTIVGGRVLYDAAASE